MRFEPSQLGGAAGSPSGDGVIARSRRRCVRSGGWPCRYRLGTRATSKQGRGTRDSRRLPRPNGYPKSPYPSCREAPGSSCIRSSSRPGMRCPRGLPPGAKARHGSNRSSHNSRRVLLGTSRSPSRARPRTRQKKSLRCPSNHRCSHRRCSHHRCSEKIHRYQFRRSKLRPCPRSQPLLRSPHRHRRPLKPWRCPPFRQRPGSPPPR
jgi:hypothetical protein